MKSVLVTRVAHEACGCGKLIEAFSIILKGVGVCKDFSLDCCSPLLTGIDMIKLPGSMRLLLGELEVEVH